MNSSVIPARAGTRKMQCPIGWMTAASGRGQALRGHYTKITLIPHTINTGKKPQYTNNQQIVANKFYLLLTFSNSHLPNFNFCTLFADT